MDPLKQKLRPLKILPECCQVQYSLKHEVEDANTVADMLWKKPDLTTLEEESQAANLTKLVNDCIKNETMEEANGEPRVRFEVIPDKVKTGDEIALLNLENEQLEFICGDLEK